MTNILDNPIFQDEAKVREWLEARVWPNGPTFPHCGNADPKKIGALGFKPGPKDQSHRPGVYKRRVP